MNLRRGFFRLWIAASFVWLVSAGTLFQEEIRRNVSTLWEQEGSVPIVPTACEKISGDFVCRVREARYQIPGDTPPDTVHKILQELERQYDEADRQMRQQVAPPPPPGAIPEVPGAPGAKLLVGDDLLVARLLAGTEGARSPQLAQGNLMFAASVLLLPPILAFALGWAGLWILGGFRR